MKTANPHTMEWQTFSAHRSGSDAVTKDYLRFKRLLRGEEGSPRNYELTLAQAVGSPPIPRHRHNFDQIRYGISGTYSFREGMPMGPGDLSYFPEGAYYGPEAAVGDPVMLVIQFGGANDFGFMSMDQVKDGAERLRQKGSFESGVYRWTDSTGNMAEKDGYEAVWDEVIRTPLVYPEPRYTDPILIKPSSFRWRPVKAGVDLMSLGSFTERRTEFARLRLSAGASYRLPPDDRTTLIFVADGNIQADTHDMGCHHAFQIEPTQPLALSALGSAELLLIRLPA